MAEDLYPNGYDKQLVTLKRLYELHAPNMHPLYRESLFAYLESQHGFMGIGGGFRLSQPNKPGFAPPGQTFHMKQKFRSGIEAYAAVDLVVRNDNGLFKRIFSLNGSGGNPDTSTLKQLLSVSKIHRSPTWAETDTATKFNLHTFITDEPWHIQDIMMFGYGAWLGRGRQDPLGLPSKPQPPKPEPPKPQPKPEPKPEPIPEDEDMSVKLILIDARESSNNATYLCGAEGKSWVDSGHSVNQFAFRIREALNLPVDYDVAYPLPIPQTLTPPNPIDGHRYAVVRNGDASFIASYGPIVGPIPPGVDEYGR